MCSLQSGNLADNIDDHKSNEGTNSTLIFKDYIMSNIICEHFTVAVDAVIDRFRTDEEMTYAEVIGCLEMIKHDMCCEAEE